MGMAPVHLAMGMAPVHLAMGMAPVHLAMGMAPVHLAVGMAPVHLAMSMASVHLAMGMAPAYLAMGMAPGQGTVGLVEPGASLERKVGVAWETVGRWDTSRLYTVGWRSRVLASKARGLDTARVWKEGRLGMAWCYPLSRENHHQP